MTNLYRQLNKLGVGQIYKYVIMNNNSSNLPYHNNFHLEHVCRMALEGCEYYEIPEQYKRLITTAALFHNFNHTGSGKDDDINIIKAVEGFLEFNTNEEFVDDEEKIIINLIKATRFPYTQDCEELTIHQKILRDSDILQGVFCQNYINGVVFAIAKEANISPEKMLEGQIKFLESATFCTEWATKIYKGALPLVIKKVEEVRKYF